MIVRNHLWFSGSTHVGLTDLLHYSTYLLPIPCLTSVAIVFEKRKWTFFSEIGDTPLPLIMPLQSESNGVACCPTSSNVVHVQRRCVGPHGGRIWIDRGEKTLKALPK